MKTSCHITNKINCNKNKKCIWNQNNKTSKCRKRPEKSSRLIIKKKINCTIWDEPFCKERKKCIWNQNNKTSKCRKRPIKVSKLKLLKVNNPRVLIMKNLPNMNCKIGNTTNGDCYVSNIHEYKDINSPFMKCFNNEKWTDIFGSTEMVNYTGKISNGQLTNGIIQDWRGLVRYEGELYECLPHGNGKLEKRLFDITQEGLFDMGNFISGKQTFGETSYNVFENHIFIPPQKYERQKFIIQKKTLNKGTYITLLIYIHGMDIAGSTCKIYDSQKHVRVISPIESGCENLANGQYMTDVFNISYNLSNIRENKDATSIQKINKTIELLNDMNEIFKSNSLFRPIIDHLYYSSSKDTLKGIFVIDSSDNIEKNIDDFHFKSRADFIYGSDSDNILPTIENRLGTHFYRSDLINHFLKEYDTINIIDLSCRSLDSRDKKENTNSHIDKPYQCVYNQESPNLEDDRVLSEQ